MLVYVTLLESATIRRIKVDVENVRIAALFHVNAILYYTSSQNNIDE